MIEVSTPPIATPQPDDAKRSEVEARSGIEAALGRESGVWSSQEPASFDRFIDPAADEAWRSRTRDAMRARYDWRFLQRPTLRLLQVEMIADHFDLARIGMDFPLTGTSMSVGRLYRQNEDNGRWYWSQPRAAWWGEARRLETDLLLFKVQERDTIVIEEIAPRLETAYLKTDNHLQLDPDVEREPQDFYKGKKLTLELVPVATVIEKEPPTAAR